MRLTKKQIEKQFPPIINGTYKKDNPNKDIGYQKWVVRKIYEVEVGYEIVAKTKAEAEELLEKEEKINLEEVDAYGATCRETITGKHISDLSGDEPTTWEKVEECIPTEDEDDENDWTPFINYDEANWSTRSFEWLKNEDGTNIEKK